MKMTWAGETPAQELKKKFTSSVFAELEVLFVPEPYSLALLVLPVLLVQLVASCSLFFFS